MYTFWDHNKETGGSRGVVLKRIQKKLKGIKAEYGSHRVEKCVELCIVKKTSEACR